MGILLGLAAFAAAVVAGGLAATGSSRPRWVQAAVFEIRHKFVGVPRPAHVNWHVGAQKRWVTVRFAKVELCGGCSAPSDAVRPRGRVATMWFDRRTGTETDFSVSR